MRCDKCAVILMTAFLIVAPHLHSSDSPVLVYRKKYVMGTVFEIAAYDPSREHASNAIELAFREIVRQDDLLSNYKPDSALSKLNRFAHFREEQVPLDLYRVIEQAIRYSRLSHGEFDISVAPLVDLWKAALAGGAMPSDEQQERVRDCVGYEKIQLLPPDRVAFHSSCLQLDLGAIGKGYAVDRAGDVLRSAGIRNALINAGGSTIFAMGSPPGQAAWLVHLRDPAHQNDPQVMLTNESVSTSEQSSRTLLGIGAAGHIIDPNTARPLKTEFAISVVAKTATDSDALSTTLLLLGPAKGKKVIGHMPDISAIWISANGQKELVNQGSKISFRKPEHAL
jgi:FAD:protein FMN transferase